MVILNIFGLASKAMEQSPIKPYVLNEEHLQLPSPLPQGLRDEAMRVFWRYMTDDRLIDTWHGFEYEGRHYDINAHQPEEDDPIHINLYPCHVTEEGYLSTNWDADWADLGEVTEDEVEQYLADKQAWQVVVFLSILLAMGVTVKLLLDTYHFSQ